MNMGRFKLLFVALFSIMCLCVSSCTEQTDCLQEIEQSSKNGILNTCSLTFDVSLQDFDSSVATRNSSEWRDGDKIYLVFSEDVYGIAEFSSGSWVLNYYGEFSMNESGTCVAYYFDNIEFESSSIVKMNYDTAPFKAEDGKYAYDGENLAVSANLKPMVGRIRFAGSPDSIISVTGITRYSSYSIVQNTFSSSASLITLTVQSDGYTPYIYGFFTSKEEPRLNVMTSESGFNRKCSTSIFKIGESGWMNVPTLKSYNGWMNNLYFKVDSVGFTMLPVKYNSSLFYLAETEVTEALCAVVYKSSKPTYPNRPEIFSSSPYYSTNSTSGSYFISKLNSLTSINFRLPTKVEWQFAAKGGELSQGYTYSGSDVISEVAWYSSNSGGVVHDVAQLMPNELGFYDMSGNVQEWTATEYSSSSNSYCYCGGYYGNTPDYCTVKSLNYSISNNYCGIRLALSIN